VREAATICPRPCKLTFDLLTLKLVSESRVTWATGAPVLVFLDLSVLDLDLMYETVVGQTDVRHASSLNAFSLWGRGHDNMSTNLTCHVQMKVSRCYNSMFNIKQL